MSETGIVLATSGLVLLGTALVLGTLGGITPLDQLGLRPHGSGLGEWLMNCSKAGVYGYDSILGSMSPPLRLQCHLSMVVILWGSALSIMGGSVLFVGTLAAGVYALIMFVVHYCLDGVSVPEGPRPSKIRRMPHWEDRTTVLDMADTPWTFVGAQDSHDYTHQKFAPNKLTGEPSGRQTWTPINQSDLKNSSDLVSQLMLGLASTTFEDQEDETAQILAQGGRDCFGFNPSKNPNSCDMFYRRQQIRQYMDRGGKLPTQEPAKTVPEATKKAAHFYSMLQCDDGHWAADYGGPHFLMPGLVVAWYVMGQSEKFLSKDHLVLLKHYILVHQQADGGWGTHLESPSTMFGSTLMYVALRLMGTPADHPAAVKGRAFLREQGGALYTSSWSKFYLCLLGCMDWKGHNSVPAEMWMLPNWCPFHPGRMWCHARMVYLPMGYLYGVRFVYPKASTDPIIQELKDELYCEPYDSIDWMKTRHWVAPMDNYSPIPWVMKIIQNAMARYEEWPVFQPFKNWIRAKGLAFSMEYIQAEDLQTNYIDIGPVNKVLNMVCHYHASGGDMEHPSLVSHLMRVADYLWVAEDGMKMQGYSGSQCWDASFCIQAMYEAGLLDEFPEMSKKAWTYFERNQILSTEVAQASPAYKYESNEYRYTFYRHISEGGWPFSSSAHGWPISDCTGEGLKGVLCLLKCNAVKEGLQDKSLLPVSDERLYKAVHVLLTYQNEDGGFATYENTRGWGWYEQLNPSEVFGDIMIDYSYVECSMASMTALAEFHEAYPNHRTQDIKHSLEKGCAFLKSVQRADGSWYGNWACCFTYGIWFGVEGLIKSGEPADSDCIEDACRFLLKHQRPNGGWGENFTSCYDKDYAKDGMKEYGDGGSGVVNTAWALMTLSMAKYPALDAVKRGVKYLMQRQLPSGDWPQEGISGVFNRSVGITYTAYRNVFPIWALGRCREAYGDALDEE
eukprot:Nitzschia sp. Nitz4//scaffold140_size61219//7444//10392//NITZ4_006431-RA/size61219-processed-gene-0.1-mRNA-1//1//CDS//3329536200//9030//frame0